MAVWKAVALWKASVRLFRACPKVSCKVRWVPLNGKSSGPEGLNSRSQSTNTSAAIVIERPTCVKL